MAGIEVDYDEDQQTKYDESQQYVQDRLDHLERSGIGGWISLREVQAIQCLLKGTTVAISKTGKG